MQQVDSFFENQGIGSQLISFAKEKGVTFLWALEKNLGARWFYHRHGFHETEEKIFEEGTPEYLLRLVWSGKE